MKKCFVVIPFDNQFENYYTKIIKPALESLNIRAIKGDEVYNNKPIINDILEQIISSDYILADVSNKSPNVNYELGLAHALSKQVIILSQNSTDISFDYRHIRAVIYKTSEVGWADSLSQKIKSTINGIDKEGYKFSSINALDNYYKSFSSENFLGLEKVFLTRQAMNLFITPLWERRIKRLDVIAFGLKSFRDSKSQSVVQQIKNGLKIRILSPNPKSIFLNAREEEEKLVKDSIRKTIIDLQNWVDRLNKQEENRTKLKFYMSTPLDFFWRQDDNLFIGPYMYGIGSQQTITFHFKVDSVIGKFFTNYFENLWTDKNFSKNYELYDNK